ncbi:MgtC/SapB family protein [Tunturiibacter gelidiferens]|uniref:MgtC/SapB family protein n=1 Tax=Tunturiibacter gelidiferens TaxID=3069689 RepID=UPI003D9B1EFE
MIGISTLQFAIRLLLAIAMGAAVGLERQWRQRMAGTRTNALVAAGAAAFVMCGLLLDNDPSARGRIVSYVVSGVGFLGAGVIFKDGASVRGLNTAATIWCSAAIGALSALGSFHLALVLAFAVLFTNMVLRPLAYRLHPVLPEAVPAETLYELKLDCKVCILVEGLLRVFIAIGPANIPHVVLIVPAEDALHLGESPSSGCKPYPGFASSHSRWDIHREGLGRCRSGDGVH